jgi:hypothetical protein
VAGVQAVQSAWGEADALSNLADLVRMGLVRRQLGEEETARTHLKEALAILRDLDHPKAAEVELHL